MAQRIPTNLAKFIAYMRRTLNYLLANSPAPLTGINWNRLNWESTELADWQTFNTTLNPLETAFVANPKNSANNHLIKKVVIGVHAYDKENHMLDRTAAGNPKKMVDDDYTVFNIKHNALVLEGNMPTERHVATLLVPSFSMKPTNDGIMKYIAKAIASSKRGNKLKDHDLGIDYLILKETDEVPKNVKQLTNHTSSTKADNTLDVGAENARLRIAVAMYWKHRTNPKLNGTHSPILVVTIV